MDRQNILDILDRQRQFFASGATFSVTYRLNTLKKLLNAIKENETEIVAALHSDLGKNATESYMCEIGMVLSEIRFMLKHLRSFAKERTVPTPLSQFAAHSYQKPCPYGTVLIMSPWNYPFLLTLGPLVDALAAGNTAVVKPSAYAPATGSLVTSLLSSLYPAEYVAAVTGGREENALLLEQKFDYIFFTGSKTVGKMVLEKAAAHLTPVTLELGGKSPCIVHKSADIKLAARRIVFGKFLNCGQTCVAPDYILCDPTVRDALLEHLKAEIRRQYGAPSAYGKIINGKHFDRILSLIDPEKVWFGGKSDRESRKIQPTVLHNVTWDDAVMQEEIFGPVLPVLPFDTVEDVISTVNSHDKPLALYLFAQDKQVIRRITEGCIFGGGCVNDCIIHLATNAMGFGGVGESGMGTYHGKAGFDTFTHYKSIVDKKTWLDLPMRYQPYTEKHAKIIRRFLK